MRIAEERATAKIVESANFIESYNSHLRVIVNKPVVEKYARKLAQDKLKENGYYAVNVTKLYKSYNGVDSKREDGWVFGVQFL